MNAKKTKFEKDCERIEEETGISVYFPFTVESKKVEVVEDDGALHVTKSGVRACFSIGQDRPLREQNERMMTVLKTLKLDQEKYLKRALWSDEDIETEEHEDEDECPHCGHSRH